MTAPNNPPGPGQPPVPEAAAAPPPAAAPAAGGYGPAAYAGGYFAGKAADRQPRKVGAEIGIGVLATVGSAVLGLAVGLLWMWLAPKVPLYADAKAVYLKDPEGEQRAGADGVFVLLGLAAGAATALAAFLLTRRRGGGVAVVVGLAVGGLLGSVAAWRIGMALGPTDDIVAHAKQVGAGKVFDASLELGAKSALLVWPMAAMVMVLALTAVFGHREEHPVPYWHGGPVPPPVTPPGDRAPELH